MERRIHDDVIAYAEENCRMVEGCVHILAVARALERIGDHSTNIGEMVV